MVAIHVAKLSIQIKLLQVNRERQKTQPETPPKKWIRDMNK